ncbi:hypothetical protein [Natronorubrum bangense]|uniref:hypothetical protein n=1 Tax=Natronorubrum bangense TaxID=61858 RepID=UPI00137629F2|nr:hypothetical protein [Natronorubrum bangense]
MTDSQAIASPYRGVESITDAFEEYQEISSTYIETQQAIVDGLQESTQAMEHYSRAYELWLDGWKRMLATDTESEKSNSGPKRRFDRQPQTPLEDRRHSPPRQRSSTSPAHTSESETVLRERIATLEHRQHDLEETLNEIHREVVE